MSTVRAWLQFNYGCHTKSGTAYHSQLLVDIYKNATIVITTMHLTVLAYLA